MRALGAEVDLQKQADGSLAGTVCGWGARGPAQPDAPLDCGNSGTTARLLMGVLAPWDVRVEITLSLIHISRTAYILSAKTATWKELV